MAVLIAGAFGCGESDSTALFCRRWLTLYDDMAAGQIETEDEFRERIRPAALGNGGSLGGTYRNLLDAVNTGDESTAVALTHELFERCLDYVD